MLLALAVVLAWLPAEPLASVSLYPQRVVPPCGALALAPLASPVGVDSLFPVVDSLAFVVWPLGRYRVSRLKFSFFAWFSFLFAICFSVKFSLFHTTASHC